MTRPEASDAVGEACPRCAGTWFPTLENGRVVAAACQCVSDCGASDCVAGMADAALARATTRAAPEAKAVVSAEATASEPDTADVLRTRTVIELRAALAAYDALVPADASSYPDPDGVILDAYASPEELRMLLGPDGEPWEPAGDDPKEWGAYFDEKAERADTPDLTAIGDVLAHYADDIAKGDTYAAARAVHRLVQPAERAETTGLRADEESWRDAGIIDSANRGSPMTSFQNARIAEVFAALAVAGSDREGLDPAILRRAWTNLSRTTIGRMDGSEDTIYDDSNVNAGALADEYNRLAAALATEARDV